jgi:hypothetical protein
MDANDERNMQRKDMRENVSTYMKNKSSMLWKASLFI